MSEDLIGIDDVDIRPEPLDLAFAADCSRLLRVLTPFRLSLIKRAVVAFEPGSGERAEYEEMLRTLASTD